MGQFSGAVKLADLNDFIAPSQACVVSIHGKKEGQIQLQNDDLNPLPEVHIFAMKSIFHIPFLSGPEVKNIKENSFKKFILRRSAMCSLNSVHPLASNKRRLQVQMEL